MSWNPFPVSAHTLHRRTVAHGETLIRNVSFLPFFNREGCVKRVLTVAPDRAEIGAIPCDVVLPRISNPGRIRIPEHVPLLYPIRKSELDELCPLWHFDPWWLLDADCYLNHWARLPIKATNCVSRTTHRLVSVLYRGDLSAATWMLHRRPSRGGISMVRWKPHFFPAPPPPRKPKRPAGNSTRWVLDPIWTGVD